jgi:hypothetical protein
MPHHIIHFAVPSGAQPVQQAKFLRFQIDAGNTHRFETKLMPPRLDSHCERTPIARRCRQRVAVACH